MMFRLAALALLTASASAFSEVMAPTNYQLRKIAEKATLLEGRGLGNNNDNNNQYQLNGNIANLSLKYSGCANVYSLGNGQGGNNNNKNGGNNIRNSAVVTFELHESGCTGALVGKYAMSLTAFTDAYTESMMTEQQWHCEAYFETSCYSCDGANDETSCYSSCANGKTDSSGFDLSVCSEYVQQNGNNNNGNNNGADFEIQRYLECQKMNNNNNNNNNNGNNNNGNNNGYYSSDYTNGYTVYPAWDGKFRIGPYCAADGQSVLLGVFYDEYCSIQGSSSVYSNLYGYDLPFSSKSIIPKSSCVSCVDDTQQNNNNNNNNNQNNNNNNGYNYNQYWNNMQPKEFCTESYQSAAKCENTGSGYLYNGGTQTGCDFINSYISTLSSSASFHAFSVDSIGRNPAAALAWVFAITTALFGAYAYFLYRKIKRGGPAKGLISDGTLA